MREISDYYTRLKKMEEEAKKDGVYSGRTEDLQPIILAFAPQKVKDFVDKVQALLPEKYKKGIPEFPEHVTILYGINPEDVKVIKQELAKERVLDLKISDYGYFDNQEKNETVLYLKVDSSGLQKIHKSLRTEFDNEHFPGSYKPHITIAFLPYGTRINDLPPIPENLGFKLKEISILIPTGDNQAEVTKQKLQPVEEKLSLFVKTMVEFKETLTEAKATVFTGTLTRQYIRDHKNTFFVFGDNLLQKGRGGQAAIARGEPNTIGIPTKKAPTMNEQDFFTDADFREVAPKIDHIFRVIEGKLLQGFNIVFFPNIGRGLSELDKRAPTIYNYIVNKINKFVRDYRG